MAGQKISQPIQSFDPDAYLMDDGQLDGSYRVVADKTARNAIPVSKRKVGAMVAWIESAVATFKQFAGPDTTNTEWTNDANWVGASGGGLVSITYADIMTAIAEGTLSAGTTYKITDRGDVALFFQAVSANQLSVDGTRIMLCPADYATETDAYGNVWLGVWNDALSPSSGELVIWGGQVWKNASGNVGASVDDITLDAEWTLITKAAFTNYEYTQLVFGCQYDWINDYAVKQWDNFDNIFAYNADFDVYNNCNISDWNCNRVGFNMYSNHCRGIYNNSSTVEITLNSNETGTINNNGPLINSIYGNINKGNISNNNNNGTIQANGCDGTIELNLNNGYISQNYNAGGISLNTINVTNIYYNYNIGEITGNSNVGLIVENHNNGYIVNCSSGANPCDIKNNVNNGNISGVFAADVTDPIVNKP